MADVLRPRGGNWTTAEIDAAVEDYRRMLEKELTGTPYSKAEHRRALLDRVQRSERSIEFKHQNISAVLEQTGQPWIDGYKPMHNFQGSLAGAVERIIIPTLDALPASPSPAVSVAAPQSIFVDLPTPANEPPLPPAVKRLARKIDQAERDHRNRELGHLGEQFVLEVEKQRLAHRPDLAVRVSWDSLTKGDGLGYDIASFDDNGNELFIEIKTTRGGIRTPFFLSSSEINAAADFGRKYRLYRLFRYGTSPQIYRLRPPLEDAVVLTPKIFAAKPK